MSLIKILIADDIDLSPAKLLSRSRFQITVKPGISNSDIIKDFPGHEILVIRSTRKIDKTFLDASSFKIIATCSKGTDHIDCGYARKKKIEIINSENGNSISAAEHTLGMIIAASKNFLLSDALVRKDKFAEYNFERNELDGKTIGIIGFGNVGSTVGRYCKALNMKVVASDISKKVREAHHNVRFQSIKYLLKYSDIISVHIPLTTKNHNYLNSEKLSLLKKSAILINTSRGEVLDEKYLIKILSQNRLRFAALDVFKDEPQINSAFYKLKNVFLTNHTAGKTFESRRKMAEEIFLKLKNIHF